MLVHRKDDTDSDRKLGSAMISSIEGMFPDWTRFICNQSQVSIIVYEQPTGSAD